MKISDSEKNSIQIFDCLTTMYPSFGVMIENNEFVSNASIYPWLKYSTLYGYSFEETQLNVDGHNFNLFPNSFLSLPLTTDFKITTSNRFFGVFRLGFQGQNVIGEVENKGRLSYIDGCSDTMLVYPPRKGDPSLNSLHFPPFINQTFHTHPSIRIGCVVDGEGEAVNQICTQTPHYQAGIYEMKTIKKIMKVGTVFVLEEKELHRFTTEEKGMKIVAFHPDGDWGPTDHDHTMLNRTYIK